jgi:NAD(P)-dependent dehydrogenase (short-subunit alcohol dehydrogenase family)
MPAMTPEAPAPAAVVTGSARGIGRGIAQRLVAQGYAVVVTDVDGAAARRTAAEVGAVAGLAQDVRDEDSHARVAAEAARHGRLAVWVNNAGVGDDGTLVGVSSESVRRLVDVNLLGVLWGMRAALAAFGPDGGDVVNVASASALGPVPGLAVYAATKAAVVSVTTSASLESPRGVRLHALCPDGVDTAMVAAMDPAGPARAMVHSSGRLLTVDETADAAVALVGGGRVVRTLPGWRAPLIRLGSLLPSRTGPAFRVFELFGRRVMRRHARTRVRPEA